MVGECAMSERNINDRELTGTSIDRVAWFDLNDPRLKNWVLWNPYCQAPRHSGSFTQASFALVLFSVDDTEDNHIQSMCKDCMAIIASDLGVSIQEGCNR